jgi:hypothetical protein
MATTIRPEVSIKNRYYIDKHRHYELKHFCLQYPRWKKAYIDCLDHDMPMSMVEGVQDIGGLYDPTATRAVTRSYYSKRMQLIEEVAKNADRYLWQYLLKGVTEGVSYTYLKTKLGIPCGKDMYYDRYRRFFWLLSEIRD